MFYINLYLYVNPILIIELKMGSTVFGLQNIMYRCYLEVLIVPYRLYLISANCFSIYLILSSMYTQHLSSLPISWFSTFLAKYIRMERWCQENHKLWILCCSKKLPSDFHFCNISTSSNQIIIIWMPTP